MVVQWNDIKFHNSSVHTFKGLLYDCIQSFFGSLFAERFLYDLFMVHVCLVG